MNVIASCLMDTGTFQAKFIPLSKVETIKQIFVLRKLPGPKINKVEYLLLPGICNYKLINILLAPILLAYYAKKKNASYIIGYHIIPHGFFAFVASVLTGVPFIISQTGLFVQKYTTNSLFKFAVLFILKRAEFFNVPGTKSKKFWIDKGLVSEKINVLHSTIDTDLFKNTNNISKYDFIYVGRFSQEKNTDLIIKAFSIICKTLPKLSLALVGYGPKERELQDLAESLEVKDKIYFLGKQNNIVMHLNSARIFVMASSSEGLPCSLMEAMSCELLVISTPVGNISDILKKGSTGIEVDYPDEKLLAEKMNFAISNYSLLHDIRKNARKIIIDTHSHSYSIDKWGGLLRR